MSEYTGIRKLLEEHELPLGTLACYERDMGLNTEEKKKEYWDNYEKNRIERDKVNPVLLKESFRIADGVTVEIFKRKNEAVRIYLDDRAPNGGGGSCDLDEALKYLKSYHREDIIESFRARVENADKL